MTALLRRLLILTAALPLATAGACGDDDTGGGGGGTDPGAVFSDSAGADSPAADLGASDPGPGDPGPHDPGTPDPGPADPGSTDPGLADPGGPDPGAADPGPADPGTPDPGSASDVGSLDAGADTGPACTLDPGADDKLRYVVVAFPYTSDYQQADAYHVWSLASDGTLAATGGSMTMARAPWGEIVFTPDGQIGAVAQSDGTLGLFRLDAAGAPTVIDAGFDGAAFLGADAFYAGSVHVGADGRSLWVLDPNWADNGGGLFRVELACDGTPTGAAKLASSKLANAMALLPGRDRAVLAADDFADHVGAHAHLLSLSDPVTWLGSSTAFEDDEAIVASAEATKDGLYALIGDNSAFSGVPNRVAVVAVSEAGLAPVQVLAPISDPAAIETSPWNNAAIVLSAADGDAIYRLDYDPTNASAPFAVAGELAYTGAGPALPSSAAQVTRGALTGRVIIAENVALRMVQFHPDGSVTDLGPTPTGGAGGEAIPGALGVQP